ncbi:DUF924 family protein [Sphingomonas montanisoli]|uniref:DUF924 domain-containing protein n=1 Tax=Sphingomonas montanisoli TaxID=2606412 RepID=A0A5D9C464_9SPHN|nr:DUF924 family protein [Sphingomonas montanisoli]TZG26062.1 DUF924 domain-containing protein [Sphingomonas montanisoli]
MIEDETTDAILDFWFREIGPDRWWERSQDTDDAIVDRFGEIWAEWGSRMPGSFLGSARDALAGVILFDQFPRNMFRGHADAFSTDLLARAIAEGAIDKRLDRSMTLDERTFLYLPFMHSEDMADQDRALLLFTQLGEAQHLRYANEHRDMIARFGRFPHRNAALGRKDRPGEAEAIEEGETW